MHDESKTTADAWLRSDQGKRAALEGWHAMAYQKIRNGDDVPDFDRPMFRGIDGEWRLYVEEARAVTWMLRDPGVEDPNLARQILRSAQSIYQRRLRLYEKMREFHDLPVDPEWSIDMDALAGVLT